MNKVDDVLYAGSMFALVERSLQRFDLVAVQLGNDMRQMVLYALKDFLIKRLGSLLEHTT